MSSQLKSDTARADGAKSCGPKSAATREISSLNSLRHGLSVCKRHSPRMRHPPARCLEENNLVKELVARWGIQRLWTVETSLIDLEMIRQPEIGKEFVPADPGFLLAIAICSLTGDSRSFSLISRRARKTLRFLLEQCKKDAAETVATQSEPRRPTPPTEPPEQTKSAETNPPVAKSCPCNKSAENKPKPATNVLPNNKRCSNEPKPAAVPCRSNPKVQKRTQPVPHTPALDAAAVRKTNKTSKIQHPPRH